MRVLIVEDEALLALEYEMLLDDLGCDPVGVARDSLAARRMAGVLQPDLALVDVNLLDGMSGADLGVDIACNLGVAVIFVTSESRHVDLGHDNILGALSKPFTARVFCDAIAWARRLLAGEAPGPMPAGLVSQRV